MMRGFRILLLTMALAGAAWLTAVTVSQDPLPDQLVLDAQVAYDEGRYDEAIAAYEQLIDRSLGSAELFYNLGSAYYTAKQPGLALLYFRKAQVLSPRDRSINSAIIRIRAERVDFQRDERNWLDRLASSTQSTFTLSEFGLVAFVWWGVGFGLAGFMIVRRPGANDLWRFGLYGFFALVLIINGLLFVRVYVHYSRPAAVVVAPVAAVYSGPGEDYLSLYQLHTAAELRIIEEQALWARFVLPDGRQGWITRDRYELVSP